MIDTKLYSTLFCPATWHSLYPNNCAVLQTAGQNVARMLVRFEPIKDYEAFKIEKTLPFPTSKLLALPSGEIARFDNKITKARDTIGQL